MAQLRMVCHAERSEASLVRMTATLRCAQGETIRDSATTKGFT